jgi:uncharacterized circularly permuted ATP-grasp superfamily protein
MEQLMNGILDSQKFENLHFDEVYTSLNVPKDHYKTIVERFNQLSISDFQRINNDVKTAFFNQGITFAVYSETRLLIFFCTTSTIKSSY